MDKAKHIVASVIVFAFTAWMAGAHATVNIKNHIPDAEQVGAGRLSFIFVNLYDAALYAPAGEWRNAPPYALRLTYLRKIPGEKIAEYSIREIRRQGFSDEQKLERWHDMLRDIFPDVDTATSITGIHDVDGATVFLKNDKEIGRIDDYEFGEKFFAIWLGEKTRAPGLRARLLGLPQ